MDIGAQSPQILEALLAKRQILFQGDVNVEIQAMITRFILYLNAVDNTPITLFIDSTGGDTEISLCICDALQQSQAEVRGVVVADANSAAFRILHSCHRRLAYPRARLLFHAPAISGMRIDDDNWAQYLESRRELHEEQLRVYAQRSGQPIERCREWAKQQKRFTANEALKAGFLDEVVEPPKR